MTETEKKSFLSQLYSENCIYLKIAANLYGANPADAADFVHDIFVTATEKVDILIKHEDPKGWLLKALDYRIKNHRRLHSTKFNRSLEEYGDLIAPEQAEPLSHVLPSQLSDSEKQILVWRFERLMDYKEMSRRLGITEEYCRVKVSRLLKKCRELMGI